MAAWGRGDGGGGGGDLFTEAYYQVTFLRLLRKVGWLGIYFSSVSEFHAEGNENVAVTAQQRVPQQGYLAENVTAVIAGGFLAVGKLATM